MTGAASSCPVCGSELSRPGGLCLKCLGRLAFQPGATDGKQPLRLGDYELLEEIARGGMGVVYRARQLSLNRIVALKVVLHGPFSSPDFVRRFRHEAEIVAALRHPNIVTIHDVGEQGGHHFIAFEYIDGRNFSQLAQNQPLPARQAAVYLRAVAEAVEHAHQRGVLHRDLKPSNILLDEVGQPRVTDFGLAKLAQAATELTVTGQVLGSPNFMSPEQAAGREAGPAADIYSLGAVLYALLTARAPAQGETLAAVLRQAQETEPVPPQRLNPSVPDDLQTICLKCLRKDPAQRYRSAAELAAELNRFLRNEPIQARPVSSLERLQLWCRRRPLLAALSAALALAVALGASGVIWQWRKAAGEAEAMRLNLYAADVAAAAHAVQNGDLGRAERTLDTLRPQPGQTDLRGFEWRFLWQQCRGDQAALFRGHTGTVTHVAFSPDSRWLASSAMDGTARIWDVAGQNCAAILPVARSTVWSADFTPDGSQLMAGSGENVTFYSTNGWAATGSIPGELAALAGKTDLLAVTPSSPFFWQNSGPASLWDWRARKKLLTLDRPARAVAVSPDGRLVAGAGPANGVFLWEADGGKLRRVISTRGPVWSLAFSHDGRQLAGAGWSSHATIWPVDGDDPGRVLTGHSHHVWSAVFSPDDSTIATTSSDETVRVWDAATLEAKGIWHGHRNEVWCAAFSPDGRWLATGGKDQNVLLWPAHPAPVDTDIPHDSDFRPLFSPDGQRLLTVNPANDHCRLIDAASRAVVADDLAGGRIIVGFSPDGTQVATFHTEDLSLYYWPTNAVPAAAAPQRRLQLQGTNSIPPLYGFFGMSPERDAYFAIDAKGFIRIWNLETGALLLAVSGPPPPIRNAVLSSHGRHLAVCVDRESQFHLFEAATQRALIVAGHKDFVSGLDFSPDGNTLATGSMDGTIRLWNAETGKFLFELSGHVQEATDVSFSPDGRTLASVGHGESLKLWHLPTGREVFSEELPKAGIRAVFSPDGRRLAVETRHNNLQLYSAPGL